MSTEYGTCPTCQSQTQTVRCDNCRNIIPNDVSPAVSGRVWNPEWQGYMLVTLCTDCEDLPLKLLTVAAAANGNSPIEA